MPSQPDIELVFEGEATDNHELDAELVAASILGVQKAVRMIASAQIEGWNGDKQRYRPSNPMRESIVVKVAAAKAGSLALPMSVVDSTGKGGDLAGQYGGFFDWLAGDDECQPDLPGNVLDHLLRSALEWIPQRADVRLRLRLRGVDHRSVNIATTERVEHLLAQTTFETLRLIAEVTRAYLDEGQVRVRHPPSQRTFRVDVPKEVRSQLSLDRGQWVAVTGKFRCNGQGEPVDIQSLEHLGLPDLSPITLGPIPIGAVTVYPRTPIHLNVTLDEATHQLYVVEEPNIGLQAFTYERADLATEIEDHIRFLWTTYASAPADQLAPDASAPSPPSSRPPSRSSTPPPPWRSSSAAAAPPASA